MASAFNFVAVITAGLAAYFWFRSATVKLPGIKSYWDGAPADDPFYKAVKRSTELSASAAVFTGMSVALSAVSPMVTLVKGIIRFIT